MATAIRRVTRYPRVKRFIEPNRLRTFLHGTEYLTRSHDQPVKVLKIRSSSAIYSAAKFDPLSR